MVKALTEEDLGKDAHGNPKLGGVVQILRRIIKHQLGLKKLEDVRATDLGFTLRGLAAGGRRRRPGHALRLCRGGPAHARAVRLHGRAAGHEDRPGALRDGAGAEDGGLERTGFAERRGGVVGSPERPAVEDTRRETTAPSRMRGRLFWSLGRKGGQEECWKRANNSEMGRHKVE